MVQRHAISKLVSAPTIHGRSDDAVARQRARNKFLITWRSRTTNLLEVAGMSDVDCAKLIMKARWGDNNGDPICPRCAATDMWSRELDWTCKACSCHFSLLSKTFLAGAKKPLREYLFATLLFVNSFNGLAATEAARHIGWDYMGCFYFFRRVRECMRAAQAKIRLSGDVEIDGAFFGGHLEKFNKIDMETGHRETRKRFADRRVVVVARQRGGKTITAVGESESQCMFAISGRLSPGSRIFADQAHCWDSMERAYSMLRANHALFFVRGETHTNNCEAFFSCLRRMQMGTHHRMSAGHLPDYAAEMAWRFDHKELTNGDQWTSLLSLLLQTKDGLAAA